MSHQSLPRCMCAYYPYGCRDVLTDAWILFQARSRVHVFNHMAKICCWFEFISIHHSYVWLKWFQRCEPSPIIPTLIPAPGALASRETIYISPPFYSVELLHIQRAYRESKLPCVPTIFHCMLKVSSSFQYFLNF